MYTIFGFNVHHSLVSLFWMYHWSMYLTGSVTQLLFHEMFKRRLDQILLSNFGVKMLIVEMYVWGH